MVEVMECRSEHRARAHSLRVWAFGRGRSIDRPSLAVILAVKDDCIDEPFDRWTLDGLADLMWTYVPQWCSSCKIERPKQLAEMLWLYLMYLQESGRLVEGSDDLEALQASLVAYGGLDRNGAARGRGRSRSRNRSRERAKSSIAPSRTRSGSSWAPPAGHVAPVIPLRRGLVGRRPPLAAT